jgi:hypothetical protein
LRVKIGCDQVAEENEEKCAGAEKWLEKIHR